jgi:nitrogen regulatory protein P-II 1
LKEIVMGFKYVVAILRTDALDALEAALRSLQVRGMTVTKVAGLGEYSDLYSTSHLTEHTKVEIFVEESRAEEVAKAVIEAAHSDVPGAGVVAVLPVDSFFHIRTGSEGLPDER